MQIKSAKQIAYIFFYLLCLNYTFILLNLSYFFFFFFDQPKIASGRSGQTNDIVFLLYGHFLEPPESWKWPHLRVLIL